MFIHITRTWNNFLDKFTADLKDVYFTENYVRLYETAVDEAFCIVYEEDDFVMLMPFLRKRIGRYYDFETPYGYGGPIFNQLCEPKIKKALITMVEHLKECGYIAGFMRFHPLLNNADRCREYIQVINDRQTVVMDTSCTEEEIWLKEISSKNRNTIRKARKSELVFNADYKFQYIDEFAQLYTATMQRRHADSFYYFTKEYYENLLHSLSGNCFLGVIMLDKKIISSAIFMYYPPYGHYHLSGSNDEFQNLCPNNLLLYEAAKELKKRGVIKFHLGGGSDTDPHNSLLEFKNRFGKKQCCFSIGKLILNDDVYQKECLQWETENPCKIEKHKHFLLKYHY
jgi:hypothetical protein